MGGIQTQELGALNTTRSMTSDVKTLGFTINLHNGDLAYAECACLVHHPSHTSHEPFSTVPRAYRKGLLPAPIGPQPSLVTGTVCPLGISFSHFT